MKNKSLKKNYILDVTYQILTIIVPFLTTPYISRILKAEGIGAYSYTLAFASYVGIFATVGMDVYGQLQTAKCRENKKACGSLVCGIFMAKLLTTTIIIMVYCVLYSKVGMYKNLYWVMILYFLSGLVDFTWFFQGLEEFAYIVTRNILIKAVSIACIFSFVRQADDVVIYALIMQGSLFLGNLVVIPYMRKFVELPLISTVRILPHLRGGMIYFIPTIATSVYTILDKAMIGWVTKSANENGYYEQAYKIVQMVLVVVTSLKTVTLPRVVRLYNEKNYDEVMEIVDSTIRFVLCISLPMSVGLVMVAPQLVPLFLGESFEKCILIVQILSMLVVILGLSVLISGQCLTAMGKQKQANSCVIVGAGINFTVNLMLIPKCGALGAAIATISAETIILLMFIIFGREHVKIKRIIEYFLKYGICSLIMGGIVFTLNYTELNMELLLVSKVGLGVIAYFGILLLIRDDMIVNFIKSVILRKIKSR